MKILILFVTLLVLASCGSKKSNARTELVQGNQEAIQNKDFFETSGYVHAVTLNKELEKNLQKCIYAIEENNSCKISELPLLRYSFKETDNKVDLIKKINERLLVSHPFLQRNFLNLLNELPIELLKMFGAVNAIVIADNISPSFYMPVTGAIYFNAQYFWLNQAEKNQLYSKKDYRSDFGKELKFDTYSPRRGKTESLWSIREKPEVTIDQLKVYTSRVIIHELSHANDYFPEDLSAEIKLREEETYDAISLDMIMGKKKLSSRMPNQVTNEVLLKVGKILFRGEEASAEILKMTAKVFWDLFKKERVADIYALSSHAEDLAMINESVMMNYYYSIEYSNVVYEIDAEAVVGGFYNKAFSEELTEKRNFILSKTLNNEALFQKIEDHVKKQNEGEYTKYKEIAEGTSWADI